MLVDLPFLAALDPITAAITPLLSGKNAYDRFGMPTQPTKVAMGVYEVPTFNFNHTLKANNKLASEYPFDPTMAEGFHKLPEDERMKIIREFYAEGQDHPQEYGVCDSWDQIVKRWPSIISDDRSFIISLSRIVKADQDPQGGWRWHKWGEYIGTKDPQWEYIYDEGPEIEEVFCFHIYEVKL